MTITIEQSDASLCYQTFFELSNHALIVIVNTGQIVDINAAYVAAFMSDSHVIDDVKFHQYKKLKSIIDGQLFDFYQLTIQSQLTNKQTLSFNIKIGETINQFIVKSIPVLVDNVMVSTIFVHENNTEIHKLNNLLQDKKRQLNDLQEVAGLGSWELDLTTGKADWTRKAFLLMGYEDQEVESIPDNFLSRIHPDDKERALIELDRPFQDSSKTYEAEFRLVMPDGFIRHVAERGRLINDENGKPLRYVGTTLDITRRKKAEEELKSHQEHLEALVFDRTKELETFSRSLSHDLYSPLRSISGFSSALYSDFFESLNDQGKNYLNRIMASTSKMDEMIQGMLRISKISKQPVKIEVVNLSTLVQDIINEQLSNFPNRKTKVEIQQTDPIKSDPQLLLIALQNLVENALKYSSNQAVSEITFGKLSNTKGMLTYFIRDNGVGFDPQHNADLFITFKRLHRNDEFEGLGIGLSTVKTIFTQLNGKIWAESEVGKGATFYFCVGEQLIPKTS